MIPYILAITLSCLLLSLLKPSYTHRNFYLKSLLSCIPLILLGGLRDQSIGTDTSGYPYEVFTDMKNFSSLPQAIKSYYDITEPIYTALAYLTSKVSFHFNSFLVVCQTFITIFWIIIFRKFQAPLILALFSFFCLYFNFSLNGVRQSIAMAVVPLSYITFTQRKYGWCFFWLLISYNLHNSSLLFVVPLGLHYMIGKFPKLFHTWQFKLLTFSLALIVYYTFSEILVQLLDLGVIKEKYITLYSTNAIMEGDLGISDLYINLGHLFFIFYYKPRNKTTEFLLLEYLALITVVLTFSSTISMFLVRITYYYQILIAILLLTFASKGPRKPWELCAFYSIYWIVMTTLNLGDVTPYTSKILGI